MVLILVVMEYGLRLNRRWRAKFSLPTGRCSVSEVGQIAGRREVKRSLDAEIGLNKIQTILRRLVARAKWKKYISYSRQRVLDPILDKVGMDWGKPIVGLI